MTDGLLEILQGVMLLYIVTVYEYRLFKLENQKEKVHA